MSFNPSPVLSSDDEVDFCEKCGDSRMEELSSESESSLSKKCEDVHNITSLSDCMIDTNNINIKNDCSDANLNPLVWQKFQFLISVLKDIQNNIQEMDSLILDRQRDVDINSRATGTTFVEENSSMDHLVNAVESSKTDEAKLNEILTLLHRITRTLSSFEQSPLLAEELKKDFGKGAKLDIDNFLRNCTVPENPQNIPKADDDNLVSNDEGKVEPHRFAKETSSLRSEIEDAIRRKNILDERLGAFLAQKERTRLEEELKEAEESDKDAPDEINVEGEYPQIKITPVNDIDEERKNNGKQNESSLNSISLINEEVINDLRNDENEIPWLAESGLSSEISSLNATINTILEENKQLYAIYNDFADPIKSQMEKETRGAKPKKKKIERKDSRQNTETFLFGEQTQEKHCLNDEDLNLNSTEHLTTPFMKHVFDRKIKKLIKEQTDMIAQLQKEKKKFNEKSQSLEKVVAELIKVNRENRMKYVEEFQAVDVENCRLEDDLLSLKRQNQKLLKDLQRLKSLQGLESSNRALQNEEFDARPCSGSDHNICLEYFRLLLMGKGIKNETPKRYDKISGLAEDMVNGSYHHISASESNLNLLEASTKANRFSSLPAIVTPDSEVSQSKRVLNTSMESDGNNYSELSGLKARIDGLESYFNQQNSEERCSKNSDAFASNGDDLLYLEREASGDLGDGSPGGNVEESQEKDVLKYKRRVSLLLNEKEEMAIRIEELMGMMRELSILFRSTKEELIATKRERNFLLENFKNRCDIEMDEAKMGSDEASLKVVELNQRLQEKCNQLELEVEKAWNESNKNALERDKMAAEKEKLNHFLTTSLAEIEVENSRLKSRLRKFEESNFKKINSEVNEKSQASLLNETKEQNGTLSLSALNVEKTELNANTSNESNKQDEINSNWQQSLIWLQRCFVEEKLHSQLLEAAERENSARVALLQQRVKDRGEKYNELLSKYKKLHLMLLSKKAEKKANKKIMKEWSYKMEEYNSTTTAIEDNYKIMLSSLGNNIGIAVEILASHLFLSPSQVHPSPELFADPAFWFAAQCSRLRWLQAELRKLCLRSWKNNDIESADVNIRRRMKSSVSDLFRGRSLDIENRNIPLSNNAFGISFSTPSSPSKVVEKVSNDHLQSVSPESNSEGCNILTSLNDAEINVTSQQVKLTQSRNIQFNNLVGILQQTSTGGVNCSSVSSSLISDPTSFRNQESFCSDGNSIENSIVENLEKYDNP